MLVKNKKQNKLDSLSENIAFAAEKELLISFNFKYYSHGDKQGQSFQEWSEDNILVDYNEKLVSFSNNGIEKLKRDGILEIYDNYPKDSKFVCPPSLAKETISWARLRFTGKKRLIGFLVSIDEKRNIFYVVFLDKNHEFAPYHKK